MLMVRSSRPAATRVPSASMAIAIVGFIVWAHHMFVAGISDTAAIYFSVATFGVAIPTAIKVFNWVATLYKGVIHLTTPMLYGLSFILLFAIVLGWLPAGGLGGGWMEMTLEGDSRKLKFDSELEGFEQIAREVEKKAAERNLDLDESTEANFRALRGEIGPGVPFFGGFDRGLPDGSAMDSQGYLWNCRYGGGCVVRVAPDGRIDRIIEMPVTNITTCTFGGPDLTTLYVTTAANGEAVERLGGSLFSIETGVPGLAEHRFICPAG